MRDVSMLVRLFFLVNNTRRKVFVEKVGLPHRPVHSPKLRGARLFCGIITVADRHDRQVVNDVRLSSIPSATLLDHRSLGRSSLLPLRTLDV